VEDVELPASTPSRWRRIPWVAVGAVLTVVAGIGSVIFTGVATYYSARVSADQLDQSREDSKSAQEEQASRVTVWVDEQGEIPRYHIANRSLQSVYAPMVMGEAHLIRDLKRRGRTSIDSFGIYVDGPIQPCTEIEFEPKDPHFSRVNAGTPGLSLTYSGFMDAKGRPWVRSVYYLGRGSGFGDLTSVEGDISRINDVIPRNTMTLDRTNVKTRPADHCDSAQ
jgi:hypothetical protein